MYLSYVVTSTYVGKTEVLLGKLWLRRVLKSVENNMRKSVQVHNSKIIAAFTSCVPAPPCVYPSGWKENGEQQQKIEGVEDC